MEFGDFVNPARAGMIRMVSRRDAELSSKPRASGDDPDTDSPTPTIRL